MTSRPDPFDTLGLPPRFDLTPAAIEAAYLTRVRLAHPDSTVGGPADAGGPDAAALNRARVALIDPERRAIALLERLGGASAEEDRSLPDGFLMEIMDVRTEVEDSLAAGGDAARAHWEDWAAQRRGEFIARVGGLLAEAAGGSSSARVEARRELNAWRYIERLIEQIDPDAAPSRGDLAD